MSYIFIEFETTDCNYTRYEYYIDIISPKLAIQISNSHNLMGVTSFYSTVDWRITRIEQINIESLQLYRKIFNFTGDKFCNIKNFRFLEEILIPALLEKEIKLLLDDIFQIYQQLDPDFVSFFKNDYWGFTDRLWNYDLQKFYELLLDWKNCIIYKLSSDLKVCNNWDKNLNNIIAEYLPTNKYIKFKDDEYIIYLFVDICNYFLISRCQEMRREKIIIDKMGILKYMDTHNVDVLYYAKHKE